MDGRRGTELHDLLPRQHEARPRGPQKQGILMGRTSISPAQKLLAAGITKNRRKLWDWHMEHARKSPPPFYCSVDLRDSGHKIVPVDSNLYPAGFNNICPEDMRSAPPIVRAQIDALASHWKRETPRKILILPESHTQNKYYIE